MLSFTSSTRLRVTDDELGKIRESFHVTKESLDVDIDNIIEWYKIQPHLPDILPNRDTIERLLIAQKCSTQRTKATLEMKYFRKYAMPDFFIKRDTRSPAILEIMNSVYYVPVPKLSPDHTRLMVIKFPSRDFVKFDLFYFLYYMFLIQEIRTNEDYAVGVRVLIDLENMTMGHLFNVNPLLIVKLETALKNHQGIRLFGLHFINGHKLLDKILVLLKQILRPKMADRIFVHDSVDEIKSIIPTEILPMDYGGDESSLNEISAAWKEHLTSDEIRNYFIEQDKYLMNEEKRPKDSSTHIMSAAGSFRQLNID